jgi:hypothetical protein
MGISHVKSITVADGTNTNIVRPGDWNSGHNMAFTLSGNTNNASTISAQNIILAGGNNITLKATGSTIEISGANAAAGTYSYFGNVDRALAAGQAGQGTLAVQPVLFPNLSFDRLALPVYWSAASNSTLTCSYTLLAGLYSRNVSSLSLISSISTSGTINHTGTLSASLYNGIRVLTVPWSMSRSGGEYWLGIGSRTSTSSANGSFSQLQLSQINSAFYGVFGAASATSRQPMLGMGAYSATTLTPPGSIAFSQIIGTTSIQLRPPAFFFTNGTVP